MKKKLLTLTLTAMLTVTALFSGCGFTTTNDKIIDTITPLPIPELGVTRVTITYVDDLYEPVYFDIPDGEQGPIGYTGNGIQTIEIKTREVVEENQTPRYMLITYTDGSQLEFPIYDGKDGTNGENGKDGLSISHIEQKNHVDGGVAIVIHYTDGSKSNEIPVPGGKNGDKITVSSFRDPEDGSTKVTFTVTDHWNVPTVHEFIIPKGEQGNSVEYIVGSMSEDGKKYILKVKIENVDELQEIEFNRPNSLLTGSKNPVDDEGDVKGDGLDGDLYYNTATKIFYIKNNGVWTQTLDLNQSAKYNIEFINKTSINGVLHTVEITPTNLYSNVPYGTFYANGLQLPLASLPSDFDSTKTYEFKGWYTSHNPNFATQSPFTDLTLVASDMTLYPVFVEV